MRILQNSALYVGLSLIAFGAAIYVVARAESTPALQQVATLPNECSGLTDPNCTFAGTPISLNPIPALRQNGTFYFETQQSLGFVDTFGETWQAPAKTLTDGASIPAIFTAIVGNPTDPEFLNAAIIHDAHCGVGNENGELYHTRPWEDVHRAFYDALISSGVDDLRAKTMYAAVYLAGPRWDDPARDLSTVPEQRLLQEMEWCLRWLRAANPGRDRITAWMKEREAALRADTHTEPNWDILLSEG